LKFANGKQSTTFASLVAIFKPTKRHHARTGIEVAVIDLHKSTGIEVNANYLAIAEPSRKDCQTFT
jgi:hypothetical protein